MEKGRLQVFKCTEHYSCRLYRQMSRKKIAVYMCILVYTFMTFISGLYNARIEVMADEGDYMIKVNVAGNCITIYEKGSTGEYTVPVKSMACAVFEGEISEEVNYVIADKEEWREMEDGTYSHYVTRISDNISICSSPYLAQANDTLDKDKFNVIGDGKSNQNIWVNTADAKWIYENCDAGANVQLYSDDESISMMEKPGVIKLGASAEYPDWDPTDDNENNPWLNKSARIDGIKDIQIYEGEEINLLDGVKGYDICGNDVTDSIIIMGTYDFNKEGKYTIIYYLKDVTGSQVNRTANLTVNSKSGVNSSGEIKNNSQYNGEDEEVEKSTGDKVEIMVGIGVIALVMALIIIKRSNSQ